MFARWIGTDTRNTAAEFTVHHGGGSSAVGVNQQLNSGLWIPLGVYDLAPSQNHRVVLTDSGTGSVAADAIRVVPVEYDSVPVYADAVRFVANDAEAVLTVHTDQLGSPQTLTDLARSVVWDASFTPFGEADSITGPANDNQRFPGQYFDAESGFHYNYFRDYDPSLGRYIQADPIGLAGGMNVYAYASGNPTNAADFTGLIDLCIDALFPQVGCNHFGPELSPGGGSGAYVAPRQGNIQYPPANRSGLLGTTRLTSPSQIRQPFISYPRTPTEERCSDTELVRLLGLMGERAVGATQSRIRVLVPGTTRYRYPDIFTDALVAEIKNTRRLSYTRQLRDYLAIAEERTIPFELYVRGNTQLSGPLREAIERGDIVLRSIQWGSR